MPALVFRLGVLFPQPKSSRFGENSALSKGRAIFYIRIRGGILDFKLPVLFDKPVEARYVRFLLAPPTESEAGIGLWELEVYESLQRRTWSDRIALPREARKKEEK